MSVSLLYLAYRQNERTAAARTLEIQRYDTFMSRIADNSFDGLVTASPEGTILTANGAAARAFRLSAIRSCRPRDTRTVHRIASEQSCPRGGG